MNKESDVCWGQFVFIDEPEQLRRIEFPVNKSDRWETIEEEYNAPSIFEQLCAIGIRTTFICTFYVCIINASIYFIGIQSKISV